MMTKVLTRGSNLLLKRFSTTTDPNIPKEFGEKVFKLFRESKYDKLVDIIDSSPYGGDINLMKLKVEALRASIVEKDDDAKRTLNMIRYMEKSNYEPFAISIDPLNKVLKF